MTTFIITFRETLEAALIIGLLLSLVNTFNSSYGKAHSYIYSGVIFGVLCSGAFAYMFFLIFGGFEGKVEKIYEGILMFIAFAMITHLLFWSQRNAKKITGGIKSTVKKALEKSELLVLFTLSFFTVVREGVETVIFLNALDTSRSIANIIWGISGILIAMSLSVLLIFGLKKIDVKKIFSLSNILLLFIAAGLLAHSIVEFQGAGIIPIIIKPIFDISSILSEKEGIGSFLKAMFGYDANPSLIAFLAYIFFLTFVGRKLNFFKIVNKQ